MKEKTLTNRQKLIAYARKLGYKLIQGTWRDSEDKIITFGKK